jgi:preprotein translocase subunit SecF
MIEIIRPDTEIDFLGLQGPFGYASMAAVVLCILAAAVIGPTYGIDFKGGTEIIVQFDKNLNTEEVREAMSQTPAQPDKVQRYGPKGSSEFMVQSRAVSVVGPRLQENAGEDDISAEAIVGKIKNANGSLKEWNWSEDNPDRLDMTFEQGSQVDQQALISSVQQLGLDEVEMKRDSTGEIQRYVMRFQGLQPSIEEALKKAVPDAYNPGEEGSKAKIERLETVGPRVGEQLRNSGILSIIVALFCILIYIGFRFDLRYAPGAVAALGHDVIIAVGFFTFTGLEISLPIIAALLTIVGYSLNDTIVVFDRIRENMETAGTTPIADVTNVSINETLSRTLITSITTLLAVVAIAALATGLIQNFAIALIVGVVIGTYSSVFVASPVMLKTDEFMEDWREARQKAEEAESSAVV